jgi:hypothetical protein
MHKFLKYIITHKRGSDVSSVDTNVALISQVITAAMLVLLAEIN